MLCELPQEGIDADPRAWHKLRATGIGASEIPTVISAEGAFSSPFDLYWRKVDGTTIPDTLSMRRGRHDEALVAELLAEHPKHRHLTLLPGGLHRSGEPGRGWQIATFDRLTADGRPVQIKTQNTRHSWGDAPDGDVPAHILAQCLQEVDVAEAGEAILPVLFDGPDELRVYRVLRDADAEADIRFMREAGGEFWQRILDRQPPPVDWHHATTEALKRIHARTEVRTVAIPRALARRLRAAHAARKAAEQRFDQAANEVRDRLGTATRAITRGTLGRDAEHPFGKDYDVIATRSVYPEQRIDVTRLRAGAPGTARKYTRTRQIDKLLVKQPNPLLPWTGRS